MRSSWTSVSFSHMCMVSYSGRHHIGVFNYSFTEVIPLSLAT